MAQPRWKIVWKFLKMLNTNFIMKPAILLPGIYSREMKTFTHTETYMNICGIIAHKSPNWSQPNYPSYSD